MSTETKTPDREHVTYIYSENPGEDYFHAYPEIDGRKCTGFSIGHLMNELDAARKVLARLLDGDIRYGDMDEELEAYFESIGEDHRNYLD